MNHTTHDRRFDFIVIDVGTAGWVLANRLLVDPAKRPLLVKREVPDGLARALSALRTMAWVSVTRRVLRRSSRCRCATVVSVSF